MLKVILAYVFLVFILGLWFNFVLSLSEKKLWRIINVVWGFGMPILSLCYPVVSAFQLSTSLGFRYVLVTSIIFIGGLASMKIIYWLLEKGILYLEKLDEKYEK